VYVAAEVKKKYPLVKIVLAGDGDMKEELQNLARQMNVIDNVAILGNVKQDKLSSLLATSIAYLSPHSGRSLVEGALAGIPLISYDWEWHSELVKDNKTGFLVPYKNWKAMAHGLIRVMDNIDRSRVLGKNARALALEIMDQKKIQHIEKEKYLELIH